MSVKCIPPHTPLLHSLTGVCRGGVYLFPLVVLQKHSAGTRLNLGKAVTIYILSRKISFFFLLKILIFLQLKKSLYIAWATFCNVAMLANFIKGMYLDGHIVGKSYLLC